MKRLQIEYKKLEELNPYENNPRLNDDAVDYVANSIKEFGFKNPIIVDKNNVIIAGHTRYKASKKLGIEEVPIIYADDLTEEQVKAFRLADNKVGEIALWDFELLNVELDGIDLDMGNFGFDIYSDYEDYEFEDISSDYEEKEKEEKYVQNINIPQYQITGECPSLEDLYNTSKTDELIKNIQSSNIEDEQKRFLIEASKRHTQFNFRNIAEYYAHADKEMQELMEQSALVIIDYNDAIKNGFANLNSEIMRVIENEEE